MTLLLIYLHIIVVSIMAARGVVETPVLNVLGGWVGGWVDVGCQNTRSSGNYTLLLCTYIFRIQYIICIKWYGRASKVCIPHSLEHRQKERMPHYQRNVRFVWNYSTYNNKVDYIMYYIPECFVIYVICICIVLFFYLFIHTSMCYAVGINIHSCIYRYSMYLF